MTNTDLISTGLEIFALFGLILWRQLATRRFRPASRTPLILAGAGALMVGQYAAAHHVAPAQFLALAVGLALSVALAFPRAASLRLWRRADGTLMRSGTWATLGWWLAVFALRFAAGAVIPRALGVPSADASAFSSVCVLLSVGVTLTVQHVLLTRRARTLGVAVAPAAGLALGPTGAPGLAA